MNGDDTVNNTHRMNNLTVFGDDEDTEDGWFHAGLGRWIGVPEEKTAIGPAHELDAMEYITRSWSEVDLLEMVGNSGAPEDATSNDSEMLPGTSPANSSLAACDDFLGVRCNRGLRCAFVAGSAIESSYSVFAKIYDGQTESRLWGVLNNGYVINVASHFYWSRTTSKLKASHCDKNDKQCMLDAIGDNFDVYPKQRIDTRDEEVQNLEQDVTGKVEWQALNKKPKVAMSLKC